MGKTKEKRPMRTVKFFALRYKQDVPFVERIHRHTLGRFFSHEDADYERSFRPNSVDLDIVERTYQEPIPEDEDENNSFTEHCEGYS